jgi:Pvc16 N-terminal domain
MATYHAIAAIGAAIVRLLDDAAQAEPDFSGATFKQALPSDFQGSLAGLGALIYLYRVSANTARRNIPPRLRPDGRRSRPALPLDLHFLLSPWASDADTQLRLLGWAMRTLNDTPILPVGLLNGANPSPEAETFGPTESVELIYDPLNLQDLASLWDVIKPRTQAGATYVARLVAIDSAEDIILSEPVQTRDLGFGQLVDQVSAGARP